MDENKPETNENEETVTMTKTDYNKAIQSAEDKLRTGYSKQIKGLENKIKELSPDKSEAELDYEKRLKELETREKKITLIDSLSKNNIDKSLADYLKEDIDVEAFSKTLQGITNRTIESNGFKPTRHANNVEVTKDEWHKMSYSEKQDFYNKNPDFAKKLMGC